MKIPRVVGLAMLISLFSLQLVAQKSFLDDADHALYKEEKYFEAIELYKKAYVKEDGRDVKEISLIEKKIGRIKTKKNDPRVCDIDIIDFKGLIIDKDDLKIPHEKSHLRNFVLYPILQIDSKWVHPIIKKNVKFLINKLDQKSRIEITRLNKDVIIKHD